jgi:VCBS repeat-containing protein
MPSTPAKTTVKVAVINNAAKDDFFQDLAWLQEDSCLQGSLNVLGNDPGSAHLIGVSQSLPTSSADLTNHSSSFVPAGFSGSLSVSINAATGQLDVDASGLNNDLQVLGEGQTTSITFYYTAQMANGAYSTAKVTIEIEGTNDDPMFSASSQLAGIVTDTAADDTFAPQTGTVSATDADGNDAGQLTYGLAAGETGTSAYGTLGIDSTGHWTFTPNDAAVEALKTTTHVNFNIQVSDGHGGHDTETVTITLNGVNDIAEFGDEDDLAGSVTEDNTLSASGTVTVSDRDAGDTGFQTPASLTGTYGDFHFNAATGAWSYDLNNASDAVQALGAGDDSETDTLTVTSADGSASETITVTVHGDNDEPEFDDTDTSGSLDDKAGDDTFDNVTGTVAATDKDAHDTLTYGLAADEDGTSPYGSFAIDDDGNWTFTPDDAAIEGLKDTTTVSFNIAVGDGHGGSDTETVTITLNGVNDIAAITGTDTGSVTEDGTLTAGATLTASDRDDSGFHAVTPASLVGTYGDFTFNASTGQWGYTLRNGDANVQALNASDTRTDTLTVHSADGTASDTITVTIHGADDGPVLAPVQSFDPAHPDPNNNDALGNPAATTTSAGASNGPDTIYLGAGDDMFNAGGGNDTIYGGSGNDTINGGNDDDTLYGGDGNDSVSGANNNDILVGGYGADTLAGSNGADTFRFLSLLDRGDTITDFSTAQGDKIDVSSIDADSSALGDQSFAWGGTTATTHGLWQVGSHIYGDVDGNVNTIEFYFDVNASLSATDFHFL